MRSRWRRRRAHRACVSGLLVLAALAGPSEGRAEEDAQTINATRYQRGMSGFSNGVQLRLDMFGTDSLSNGRNLFGYSPVFRFNTHKIGEINAEYRYVPGSRSAFWRNQGSLSKTFAEYDPADDLHFADVSFDLLTDAGNGWRAGAGLNVRGVFSPGNAPLAIGSAGGGFVVKYAYRAFRVKISGGGNGIIDTQSYAFLYHAALEAGLTLDDLRVGVGVYGVGVYLQPTFATRTPEGLKGAGPVPSVDSLDDLDELEAYIRRLRDLNPQLSNEDIRDLVVVEINRIPFEVGLKGFVAFRDYVALYVHLYPPSEDFAPFNPYNRDFLRPNRARLVTGLRTRVPIDSFGATVEAKHLVDGGADLSIHKFLLTVAFDYAFNAYNDPLRYVEDEPGPPAPRDRSIEEKNEALLAELRTIVNELETRPARSFRELSSFYARGELGETEIPFRVLPTTYHDVGSLLDYVFDSSGASAGIVRYLRRVEDRDMLNEAVQVAARAERVSDPIIETILQRRVDGLLTTESMQRLVDYLDRNEGQRERFAQHAEALQLALLDAKGELKGLDTEPPPPPRRAEPLVEVAVTTSTRAGSLDGLRTIETTTTTSGRPAPRLGPTETATASARAEDDPLGSW